MAVLMLEGLMKIAGRQLSSIVSFLQSFTFDTFENILLYNFENSCFFYCSFFIPECENYGEIKKYPQVTGRKVDAHKTFSRRASHVLNILNMFHLRLSYLYLGRLRCSLVRYLQDTPNEISVSWFHRFPFGGKHQVSW